MTAWLGERPEINRHPVATSSSPPLYAGYKHAPIRGRAAFQCRRGLAKARLWPLPCRQTAVDIGKHRGDVGQGIDHIVSPRRP